jgi:hypothetical protein
MPPKKQLYLERGCSCAACNDPFGPTPQLRKGPLGDHSCCNACGVAWDRYLNKQHPDEVGGKVWGGGWGQGKDMRPPPARRACVEQATS